MRFAAFVNVELPSDVIQRSPTFWDWCKGLTGAKVDLSTERVRSRVEAATFLYQVRRALDAIHIGDARSLVVDDVVVFEDTHGQRDDLPELMAAFGDHVLVLTETPKRLSLSVEHEEAGLSIEVEARFVLEHAADEPAACVSVVGRIFDLAPRPLESSETYRTRVENFLADPKHGAAVRLQFATFVSRIERALAAALPGASLETTLRALGPDGRLVDATLRAPGPDGRPIHEQVRPAAAVTGPPSFAVRLRRIERLQTQLVKELAVSERESLDAVPPGVQRGLMELNRLIRDHNQYCPIERDMPMDPATGELLGVSSEPWKPRPPITIEELRHITASMRSGGTRALLDAGASSRPKR